MSKKGNRKLKSKHEAQLSFRRIMSSSGHPRTNVSVARNFSPVSSYTDLISLIKQNPFFRRQVFNPEYPRNFSDLEVAQPLAPTDIQREYRWAGAYLAPHVSKLAQFISLSNTFQRSLLLSKYATCEQTLTAIESEFGQSLWLIKNKLAFLQAVGGLDTQKRYLKTIFNEVGNIGNTPYIAYYVSFRNEASVSPNGFSTQFNQHLSEIEVPADLEDYLRYHILPVVELTQDQIRHILRQASAGAVIDYFETLIEMSQVVVGSAYTELYPVILTSFKDLRDRLADPRIAMLFFHLGDENLSTQIVEQAADGSLDEFLRGHYEKALTIAIESINERPDQFDLLEIAARAAAILQEQMRVSDQPYSIRLISKMRSVIAKESTANEDLMELVKVAMNHRSFPWSHSLLAFLRKEVSSDPLETGGRLESVAASATPYINPMRISALTSLEARQAYSRLTEKIYGKSLSVSYGRANAVNQVESDLLEELAGEEGALLNAEISLRTGTFDQALDITATLLNSPHSYYRHKAVRLKAYCLLKLGRLDECINFVTSTYVSEQNLHFILPIKELVESIDENTREQFSADISVPILYDMYSKYVGAKYDPQRRYATEDLLISHGIQRPSKFTTVSDKFPRDKVIYYLRHLCVETVIDSFSGLNSSREVAEERLAVCRVLVELDEQNADIYQAEIREILRRLVIQTRMREIEQSKIYVDIDSIRKAAEKSLRESFNRYMAYRRYELDDTISAILETLNKINTKPDQRLVLLRLPSKEMSSILVSMIQELRDQYVSSKNGLDGYLSVRVRHGTLTNQLRNPLEAHNLVTQKKDSITNEYKRNEYWIGHLGIVNPALQNALTERLAKFSQDFDLLVKNMLADWIQVKKEPSGIGLFDFSLSEELIISVSASITPETTFEQFLDIVFQVFGDVLNRNLEVVRTKIETNAKPQVNDLITSLQTDVDKLLRYPYYPNTRDLNNAIRAVRTEMQVALDRIAEWFRLSKSTANEPFFLEDAVNIGMESLRTSSQGFNADITIEGEDKKIQLEGRHLINFVDIFFTIFENIVRHSQTTSTPKAEVKITYDDKSVHFLIENEVGPGVVTDATKNKLEVIRSAMQGDRYIKSVTREGGTGFHKIWKIIAHDFRNPSPLMHFGFRENARFFVEFVVFTKEISHEHAAR